MKYDSTKKPHKLVSGEPLPRFKESTEMKRLTIDVPAYLHANVKAGCARQGIKMADAIRELLEEKFGNVEQL